MKINMQKLNKHLFPCFVVLFLLMVLCTPLTASAAWYDPIDYTELDYSVRYGTEYNIVTIPLPENHYVMTVVEERTNYWPTVAKSVGEDTLVFEHKANTIYDIRVYPAGSYGMCLEHIPVGAKLQFDLLLGIYSDTGGEYYIPSLYQSVYYTDENFDRLKQIPELLVEYYEFFEPVTLTYVVEDVDGAKQFVPYALLSNISFDEVYTSEIVLSNVRLEMDVSVEYWTQWQNEQNGKKLDDIKDSIEDSTNTIVNGTPEQNEAADKFSDSMDSAIGDLESAGDSLNQVDTPEVDVDELIPNDVLLGEAYLNYISAIKPFWDCKPLVQILTVLGVLILISVVFFGLRG